MPRPNDNETRPGEHRLALQIRGRCGRCGDERLFADDGPHKGMLCRDCADEVAREAS